VGLKTFVFIFNKAYETGRKLAQGFKESMRIVFDKHLRQWNYSAIPEATILLSCSSYFLLVPKLLENQSDLNWLIRVSNSALIFNSTYQYKEAA